MKKIKRRLGMAQCNLEKAGFYDLLGNLVLVVGIAVGGMIGMIVGHIMVLGRILLYQ